MSEKKESSALPNTPLEINATSPKTPFGSQTVFLAVALCLFLSANPLLNADTITLNSGEVVDGTIKSEDFIEIQIEVANAKRTVFSTRTIYKSAIRSIQRETEEQKTQRELLDDYKKTQSYQLNATTNYACAYYDSVTGDVFRRFVSRYPNSQYIKEISDKIAEWEAERAIVATGKVKYQGQWFDADEAEGRRQLDRANEMVKKVKELLVSGQYERAAKILETDNASGQTTSATNSTEMLQATYHQFLDTLNRGRKQINDAISQTTNERNRACQERDSAQSRLDSWNYPYSYPYGYGNNKEHALDVESERSRLRLTVSVAQSKIVNCESRLADLNKQLASTDGKIAEVQLKMTALDANIKLKNDQQAKQLAEQQAAQQAEQRAKQLADQQAQQLAAQQAQLLAAQQSKIHTQIVIQQVYVPVKPEENWYKKNWKWIGGFVLAGLAIFAFSRRDN